MSLHTKFATFFALDGRYCHTMKIEELLTPGRNTSTFMTVVTLF